MLEWIISKFLSIIILVFLYLQISLVKKEQEAITTTTENLLWSRLENKTRIPSLSNENKDMKYILLFPFRPPLDIFVESQTVFINNHCKHTNCYITTKRNYLKDVTDFDAILFSGIDIQHIFRYPLKKRTPRQVYVYCNLEAGVRHSVTHPFFDNFFNWTWTYKLDSSVTWKYFKVYDLKGNELGPTLNMKWPKTMRPITEQLKWELRHKSKIAAAFVSQCKTHSRREIFVGKLEEQLNKYGLSIDVYGTCGKLQCYNDHWCNKLLRKYYYFYLSFENALDIDYVTETILRALQNLAVPIIYGGADYSRFLPPGSYLNARKLGPEKLAKVMNHIITNKTCYYDYFRWRNHFRFESSKHSEMCNICTALNDDKLMNTSKTYVDFRTWWHNPVRQEMFEFLLRYFIYSNDLLDLVSHSGLTNEVRRKILRHIHEQKTVPRNAFTFDYDQKSLDLPKPEPPESIIGEINRNITALDYNFSTTDLTEFYIGSTINMDYSETVDQVSTTVTDYSNSIDNYNNTVSKFD